MFDHLGDHVGLRIDGAAAHLFGPDGAGRHADAAAGTTGRRRPAQLKATLKRDATMATGTIKKLVADEGWRIRIGAFRALFLIDDTSRTVTVYDIDVRSKVYRKRH